MALALVFSQGVHGEDQLDDEAKQAIKKNAPKGVIVKVDEKKEIIEVYKIPELDAAIKNKDIKTNHDEAIKAIATDANKVASYKIPKGELEKEGSREAFYYGYYGRGRYGRYYGYGGWGVYNPYIYNGWGGGYVYGARITYGYVGSYYTYPYAYTYAYNNCNYGVYY